MLGIDLLKMNKGRLSESWSVTLGDYIIDLAWSPDGGKLAAATVEGAVYLIANDGSSVESKRIGQHAGGANSVSWRSDGAELATAGQDLSLIHI